VLKKDFPGSSENGISELLFYNGSKIGFHASQKLGFTLREKEFE
jgi:hypothetical protein